MKPTKNVTTLARKYGWKEVATGGGCTALRKDFDEGGNPPGRYCLITDDASVPDNAMSACTLGFYDGENPGGLVVLECPNLKEAMWIAASQIY